MNLTAGTATADRERSRPAFVAGVGGALCGAFGVFVMLAWHLRVTGVLTGMGRAGPMVYGTALGVALTGFAIVAVALRRPVAVVAAAVYDLTLGVLTLLEYRFKTDLGIDQLFVRAYVSQPGQAPGRIAPNTAVCLIAIGVGLLVWRPWRRNRRPVGLAAAGSLVVAMAVVALFGYAAGIPTAYGWGHVTSMALSTGLAMLVLGVSLVTLAWSETSRPVEDVGWVAIPIGVSTMSILGLLWAALIRLRSSGGTVSTAAAAGGALLVTVLMAGILTVIVWLARRASLRHREAVALAEQLREADTLKTLFLRAVAHDLRNPLTVIRGFAETLETRRGQLTVEEESHLLARISAGTHRLSLIVANLLDFAVLEQGAVEVRREPTDLDRLIAGVVEHLDLRDHPVHMGSRGVVAAVDPIQVEHIIENLIANAVRHTPAGTQIWILAEPAPDGVLITVEDSGPGVPDDVKASIFEAFSGGSPNGTGLGLSIVAGFAALHAGRVWVEDRPGGGAAFKVMLSDRA